MAYVKMSPVDIIDETIDIILYIIFRSITLLHNMIIIGGY
jgi:hypothetical protein